MVEWVATGPGAAKQSLLSNDTTDPPLHRPDSRARFTNAVVIWTGSLACCRYIETRSSLVQDGPLSLFSSWLNGSGIFRKSSTGEETTPRGRIFLPWARPVWGRYRVPRNSRLPPGRFLLTFGTPPSINILLIFFEYNTLKGHRTPSAVPGAFNTVSY